MTITEQLAADDDEQVERVARAIYAASPTVWIDKHEPTTMVSPAYQWVKRPVPWDELVEDAKTTSHDASSVREIRALARAAIAAMSPQDEIERVLADPVAVHLNMLRGGIAKPSIANIIHLYGADALRAALPPQVSPELIEKLGKLANYLTAQGEYEACDLIDTVVERLTPKAKG